MTVTDYNHITGPILNAAIEVHKGLGPGPLESVYMPCFEHELRLRNLQFDTQCAFPIRYKEIDLARSCRIDLIIERVVVVELKSIEALLPVHAAQLLTCLRLANCPVCVLINFNTPRLMDGVQRKVNPRGRVVGA